MEKKYSQNDRYRDKQYRNLYGISLEEYEEKLRLQNGVCALCGEDEKGTTSLGNHIRLSVDHCHTTGKVRDLLCSRCNRVVEVFDNNTEDFIGMVQEYVRRHRK